MPKHQRHRRRRQRAEHREQNNQDDRKVPLLGLRDVVLGGQGRGRTQCALADHVKLDLAVLDLAGLIAVDADLLPQLFGDVDRAGVVEVQLQGEDVRPVRLGSRLLRIRHDLDAWHLGGDAFELGDRVGHVLEGCVGAGGRDQRQRGRTLVGEMLFELALHVQRLGSLDFEAAAGQIAGLVHRQIDRGNQKKQPSREHRPAISAQVAAQAHHELLDSELPAFCPALRSVSVQQRRVRCRRLSNALTLL